MKRKTKFLIYSLIVSSVFLSGYALSYMKPIHPPFKIENPSHIYENTEMHLAPGGIVIGYNPDDNFVQLCSKEEAPSPILCVNFNINQRP